MSSAGESRYFFSSLPVQHENRNLGDLQMRIAEISVAFFAACGKTLLIFTSRSFYGMALLIFLHHA
jgi:hypothetical protein